MVLSFLTALRIAKALEKRTILRDEKLQKWRIANLIPYTGMEAEANTPTNTKKKGRLKMAKYTFKATNLIAETFEDGGNRHL